MFEQNNVGVRMQSPLATLEESLTVESEGLADFLEATETIVRGMEGESR
jgi:hypothetical protein